MPRTTARSWINKHRQALNLNKFNQLSEDSFLFLLDFAILKHKTEAIELNRKIRKAGVKVFLYGMAGKEVQNDIENKDVIISDHEKTISDKNKLLKKQEKHHLITYQNGNQCLRKWKNEFQDKYGIYINERKLWMFLQSKGIVNYIRKTTCIKRVNDIYFGDQVQDSIAFNDNIEEFLNENNMI